MGPPRERAACGAAPRPCASARRGALTRARGRQELKSVKENLERVRMQLADSERVREEGSQIVEERKAGWLDGAGGRPGLRSLVQDASREFSEFFRRMGNVGEVRLDEAKDANGQVVVPLPPLCRCHLAVRDGCHL